MKLITLMTNFTPICFFVVGGLICIGYGHPEFAGLGIMIVGGLLRIAFGYENEVLRDLQRKIDALK